MKNINLLKLSDIQAELLQKKLELHSRFSNINFRIVSANDSELVLVIHQGESFHENRFDHKRLREIAHETFDDILLPGQKLHVSIKVDVESPPDIVTPGWISDMMYVHKTRIKDMVTDTGIDKATISAYINNHKPLSHVTKAMFFYYFKSKTNVQ
jgi:hypothetical protein